MVRSIAQRCVSNHEADPSRRARSRALLAIRQPRPHRVMAALVAAIHAHKRTVDVYLDGRDKRP
jgi:hypothetical protein